MKPLLSVTNLQIKRSQAFALRLTKLRLPAGKLLCIAGPNGGGKTTLIECLVGLLRPDSGQITLAGQTVDNNLKAVRKLIGYVPDDEAWLVKELCAREYFDLLITVYRQAGVGGDMPARVRALSSALYFTNFRQPLEQLSHGNKKKVQLIAALVHQPKLIVIDELRNGLDPLAVIAAEQLLREEAKRGTCIVVSTHDLWWAERMADTVLLLVDGRPAANGPTKKLAQAHGSLEKLFLKTVKPGASHAV